MKKTKANRGFTLIELLVVIAIIGILASIVLASLNTARNKGADAAIKGSMSGIRAQAEIDYDTPNCYVPAGTTCAAGVVFTAGACAATANTIFADTNISNALISAGNAYNGGGIASGRCSQVVNGGAWAVAMPLKTGGTAGDAIADAYCVDSTGQGKSFVYGAGQTLANAIVANVCQ